MKKHLYKLTAAFVVMTAALPAHAQQVMSTFAGQYNSAGYLGDGGPATDANLYSPSDVITDGANNLYIADFINNVVRKVTPSGTITTVAGTGFGAGGTASGDYTGDGGPATSARLNGPFALAMDQSGNMFIADGYNHVVRKVDASGNISTYAGRITAGYSGDGGPATAAELNNPVGLAVDKTGNLYIADDHNNVIRKVDAATGNISTFAGSYAVGSSGDGGPATNARMSLPIGVAFDTAGNLYIADAHNSAIRKVDKAGMMSTAAGNFAGGYSGDGGPATAASIDTAERVSFDASNNMYISDMYNHVIRKVDGVTGIISTFAGDGTGAGTNTGAYGGDDSIATKAQLYFPHGIAFDKTGLVYIADRGNDLIRKIGPKPVIDHSVVRGAEVSSKEFVVYPNPATSGLLNVTLFSDRVEQVQLSIRNVLGQTVKDYTISTNKAETMSIAGMTPGIYTISAATTNRQWTKRLVVE